MEFLPTFGADHLNLNFLDSLQSSILITDANSDEHVAVYANAAFENLTGFTRSEIVGQNCRFLQRNDADQDDLIRIRDALDNHQPVQAVLRNYRKNGDLFYNELFINPIRDSQNIVTHFISSQNAIANEDSAHIRQQAIKLFTKLSARERRVFELITDGRLNKEVAYALNISVRTVEKHRLHILEKMEAKNITQLVRYAVALGTTFQQH